MSSSPVVQIIRRSKRRAAIIAATEKMRILEPYGHNHKSEDLFLNGELVRKNRQSSEKDSLSLNFPDSSPSYSPSILDARSKAISNPGDRTFNTNNRVELPSAILSDYFQVDDLDEQTASVEQYFDPYTVLSSEIPPSSTSPKSFSSSVNSDRLNDALTQLYDYHIAAQHGSDGIGRKWRRRIRRQLRRCKRLVNSTGPMELSMMTQHRLSMHTPNKSPIRAKKLIFTHVAHIPTTPVQNYENFATKLRFSPVAGLTTTPEHVYHYKAPIAAAYPAKKGNTLRSFSRAANGAIKPQKLL